MCRRSFEKEALHEWSDLSLDCDWSWDSWARQGSPDLSSHSCIATTAARAGRTLTSWILLEWDHIGLVRHLSLVYFHENAFTASHSSEISDFSGIKMLTCSWPRLDQSMQLLQRRSSLSHQATGFCCSPCHARTDCSSWTCVMRSHTWVLTLVAWLCKSVTGRLTIRSKQIHFWLWVHVQEPSLWSPCPCIVAKVRWCERSFELFLRQTARISALSSITHLACAKLSC